MKMYVLVLKSLSKSQQAVQAGHALAEYLIRSGRPYSTDLWNNGDLVYLKATENELIEFGFNLSHKAVLFREIDLHNQITAVAMLGGDNDPRFIDFRLV